MGTFSVKKGFTLIELIIVLAVIGIILSMAVYGHSFSGNHTLLFYARQLSNDIINIRQKSMTTGVIDTIYLNYNGYIIKNNTNVQKQVVYKQNYEIYWTAEGGREISFGYDGQILGKGNTITVKNTKTGRKMDITIVPGSGRVLLYDKIY